MSEKEGAEQDVYRLFVDESGDHVYNLLELAEHRYLALLGLWFRVSEYERFERDS